MADEAVYEAPFIDFIEAIKNQNFQQFKHQLSILSLHISHLNHLTPGKHPEFANKVEATSKQTPLFFAVLIPNEEIALMFIRELLNAGTFFPFKITPINLPL